ncbi:MAG: V-type ATP synthase subunit F [Clostridia bacterium]|nr:V-type ATP synthase subunit F [Clostridia bacterium]
MSKIAAMGDRDSIYGFASVGLEIFPLDRMENPAQTLNKLANGDYAIILVTEALAKELEQEIDKYSDRPLPVILTIPGVTGNEGMGMKAISKSVEKAVGSDILQDQ